MLYKNLTRRTLTFETLKGRVWSMDQDGIGPGTVVDISEEMLSDHDIKTAIRTGVLIPVSQKRRIKVPWCPKDGSHAMTNGAAPQSPIPPCKHCGRGNLFNNNHYCPTCFTCFTCDRLIKRKYK